MFFFPAKTKVSIRNHNTTMRTFLTKIKVIITSSSSSPFIFLLNNLLLLKTTIFVHAFSASSLQGIDPEALEIQKADDWFLNDALFVKGFISWLARLFVGKREPCMVSFSTLAARHVLFEVSELC